jgi:hypothetical protein
VSTREYPSNGCTPKPLVNVTTVRGGRTEARVLEYSLYSETAGARDNGSSAMDTNDGVDRHSSMSRDCKARQPAATVKPGKPAVTVKPGNLP